MYICNDIRKYPLRYNEVFGLQIYIYFSYICKKFSQKNYVEIQNAMIRFDLQTIRRKKNISQKKLAEITCYPQGFVSVIERGKASAPEAFIKKVAEILNIDNIDDYVTYIPNESLKREKKKADISTDKPIVSFPSNNEMGPFMSVSPEQSIVSQFLELLRKKEEKIEKLEAENRLLRDELTALKLSTSTKTST